jgi:hypothetical protein
VTSAPRNRRPQPGGWDTAVTRLLKPEHVEISGTQRKVTLPPCPDFDIEEDEEVEVWVPPQLVAGATGPIYAGKFTISADSYEERIDHALHGLKEERAAMGPSSPLATFLVTFFTCEILAKAVVSYDKNRGTGRKTLPATWPSNKEIAKAIKACDIQLDLADLDALFTKHPATLASEMSARELRDCIVHRMKGVHRDAVRTRYAALMGAMDLFLGAVATWRDTRRKPGQV